MKDEKTSKENKVEQTIPIAPKTEVVETAADRIKARRAKAASKKV